MTTENKFFRLAQMVLVNAGTNKHLPSNRITAIDPRGGAAVVGENGVGKTTTLRIIPLFFGHLPSALVAHSSGQEAMVRFILPLDSSAIAFEYCRGSDNEQDMRLAVIRRRESEPNTPFYRIFRCGYRQDLFVKDGVFLSDAQSIEQAGLLGVSHTTMLTSAEYRSVILRVPATSKEKERLRRYAVDYSFGPQSLDNLDRLVASMVKRGIEFKDIIQVAVGLIQNDLGHAGERQRIAFKQGREPLQRWLDNRAACLQARSMQPVALAVEELLQTIASHEASIRSAHSDVVRLHELNERQLAQLRQELQNCEAAYAVQSEALNVKAHELRSAVQSSNTARQMASTKFAELDEKRQRFSSEDALAWAQRVQELPSIEAQASSVRGRLRVAQADAKEAQGQYAQLKDAARERFALAQTNLNDEAVLLSARHREGLQRLEERYIRELDELEELRAAGADELNERVESLAMEHERAKAQAINAKPSAQSIEALDGARAQRDRLATDVARGQQEVQSLRAQERLTKVSLDASQSQLDIQLKELRRAQQALQQAREQYAPANGTLLSALRTSDDQNWRTGLAKVLNDSLLSRTDLRPEFLEDDAKTLGGWSLDLSAVPSPAWSDDVLARAAVDEALSLVERINVGVQERERERDGLAVGLEEAGKALSLAVASHGVLVNKHQETQARCMALESALAKEVAAAKQSALEHAQRLQKELEAAQTQRRARDREFIARRDELKKDRESKRLSLMNEQEQERRSVDARKDELANALRAEMAMLDAQLQQHLKDAGVDAAKLLALQEELAALERRQEVLEGKKVLVGAWTRWIEEDGPEQVLQAHLALERLTEESDRTRLALSSHEMAREAAGKEHFQRVMQLNNAIGHVEQELVELEALVARFDTYLPLGESVVNRDTSARQMRSRVDALLSGLDKSLAELRAKSSRLTTALTSRESSVKELIVRSLPTDPDVSEQHRAALLLRAYKEIGPQVYQDVNLTLISLLRTVESFYKSLENFEAEVRAFNRRLQSGLGAVKYFERVTDLQLNLVTNFEEMSFHRKLVDLRPVIHKYSREELVDSTKELPGDDAAAALAELSQMLGSHGNIEVNLSDFIRLEGSVTDNGQVKRFRRASELENISSTGLTSLILITLLTALLNTIRGSAPVYVPWVTDEVGKFDTRNFKALMRSLLDNKIDVVTASPELGHLQLEMFSQRYVFEDRGRIRQRASVRPGQGVAAGVDAGGAQ